MGRASLPSGRGERKKRKLWCPSLTAAWGCPHRVRNRSSMPSLLPSRKEPAWDFALAAPSSNHLGAVCGLPTTPHAVRVFISLYRRKSRQRNEPRRLILNGSAARRRRMAAVNLIGLYNYALVALSVLIAMF